MNRLVKLYDFRSNKSNNEQRIKQKPTIQVKKFESIVSIGSHKSYFNLERFSKRKCKHTKSGNTL